MFLAIFLGVLGVFLITLEVFLPGLVIGISGALCIAGSVYFSFITWGPPGLIISAVVCIASVITAYFFALKLVPKTPMGKGLFLQDTQAGYDTKNQTLSSTIGKTGLVVSALRPTGKIEIEDKIYDSVTEGDYVTAGEKVIVVGIKSNQLFVEPVR